MACAGYGEGDVFDPPAEGWPQTTVTPAPVETPPAPDVPEDESVPNPAQREAFANLSRMRGQGIKNHGTSNERLLPGKLRGIPRADFQY
jgi:hypothetical protein